MKNLHCYRLLTHDGTRAEPDELYSGKEWWAVGDEIAIRPGRTYRVIGIRIGEGFDPSQRHDATLIVETQGTDQATI